LCQCIQICYCQNTTAQSYTNCGVWNNIPEKPNCTTHATLTPPVGAEVAYTAHLAPCGGANVAVTEYAIKHSTKAYS